MMRTFAKLAMVLVIALVGDAVSGRVLVRGAGLVWFVFTAMVFALGVRWAFGDRSSGAGKSGREQTPAAGSKLPMVVVSAILYGVGGHLLRPSGQEALLISVESAVIALLAGVGGLVMSR
jgi:hypothetical protein